MFRVTRSFAELWREEEGESRGIYKVAEKGMFDCSSWFESIQEGDALFKFLRDLFFLHRRLFSFSRSPASRPHFPIKTNNDVFSSQVVSPDERERS